MAERDLEGVLADIEERLDGISSTMEILLALRIMADGHALDWRVAILFARDPDRLRKLYPAAFREAGL